MRQARTGLVLIAVLLAAMLGGCAPPGAVRGAAADGALSELIASVEYIDDDNQVVDPRFQAGHLVLVFPYIPGRIFGTPGNDLLFTVLLTPEDRLHLELSRAEPGLRAGAATLQAGAETTGLSLRPARTRFARIGTFPFDAKTRQPLGAGGFVDGGTRENLVLMYFDRACALTGEVAIDDETYVHDISIHAAGFYFLRIRQDGPRRYVLQRVTALPPVVFTIRPTQLQPT